MWNLLQSLLAAYCQLLHCSLLTAHCCTAHCSTADCPLPTEETLPGYTFNAASRQSVAFVDIILVEHIGDANLLLAQPGVL